MVRRWQRDATRRFAVWILRIYQIALRMLCVTLLPREGARVPGTASWTREIGSTPHRMTVLGESSTTEPVIASTAGDDKTEEVQPSSR